VLEFVDTQDMTVMAQTEHFMATNVEWDPTGRYVTSAVSWWGHKVDNAFWVWNFQGNLVAKQPMERFCQLMWRPRPPSLLPDKQVKEIKRNFKTWAQKFETEDAMRKMTASKEKIEERQALMREFMKLKEEKQKRYDEMKTVRLELRDGVDTDEFDSHANMEKEETIEFLVKVTETIEE